MKINFKSIVAGLVLACVGSPLLAARMTRVVKPVKIRASVLVAAKEPLLAKVQNLASCTVEINLIYGSTKAKFTGTAAICEGASNLAYAAHLKAV